MGNRKAAYTTVALAVAQFEEYRQCLLDHVMDSKLFHWDIAIRLLSSKSLSVLVPLETDLAKAVVIPTLLQKSISSDLIVRHGAVVGLAETVLALTNTEWKENDETLRVEIAELVPKIEKLRLYRGRGGEIMRSAVCRLVECISQSKLALTVKQQVKRTLSSPSRTNVLTPLFLFAPNRYGCSTQSMPTCDIPTKTFSALRRMPCLP